MVHGGRQHHRSRGGGESDERPNISILKHGSTESPNQTSSSSSSSSNTTSPTSPPSDGFVRLRPTPHRLHSQHQRASYACGENMDASRILEQSPIFRSKITQDEDNSKSSTSLSTLKEDPLSSSTSSINAR